VVYISTTDLTTYSTVDVHTLSETLAYVQEFVSSSQSVYLEL